MSSLLCRGLALRREKQEQLVRCPEKFIILPPQPRDKPISRLRNSLLCFSSALGIWQKQTTFDVTELASLKPYKLGCSSSRLGSSLRLLIEPLALQVVINAAWWGLGVDSQEAGAAMEETRINLPACAYGGSDPV